MFWKTVSKILVISVICTVSCYASSEPPKTVPSPTVALIECNIELEGTAQVIDAQDWRQVPYQLQLKRRSINEPKELLVAAREILSGTELLSAEDDDFLAMALMFEKNAHIQVTILTYIESQKRALTQKQTEALTILKMQSEDVVVPSVARKILMNPPKKFDAIAEEKQSGLNFPSLNFDGSAGEFERYQQLRKIEIGLESSGARPSADDARGLRKIAQNDLDPKVRKLALHLMKKYKIASLGVVK